MALLFFFYLHTVTGSYQEVQYALMTFGITEFPVEVGSGQVLPSFFGNLIDAMKQQEEEQKEREKADGRIVVAMNRDVLMGTFFICFACGVLLLV
jgi:hypothetical protein